jgi:hypothetical protein
MVTAVATSVSTSAFVTRPKVIRAPGQPGAALDGAGASAGEAVAGAVDRVPGAEPSQEESRSNVAISDTLTARVVRMT